MAALLVGQVLERWPGRESLQMLIAVILADAADPDGGNVYPSVERVARLARCGVRSVQYSLRDFINMGFLLLEHPGGGRGRPARYRIVRAWLEAQESALQDWQKKGADAAGNSGTVHSENRTPQKACKNHADSPQRPLHPTQQPLSNTRRAAAAQLDYELTVEGILTEPGNVLDELGLSEIRRLADEESGIVSEAIGCVIAQGKRPFVSAVLSNAQGIARRHAQEKAKQQRDEALKIAQQEVIASDPGAQATGNAILSAIASRRAAKTKMENEHV